MNPNVEYEKLVQEIYQGLLHADGLKSIKVQHNIKLRGRSGQEHQIDVYWEYEIADVEHKVAIECKNYKNKVSIGKIRDFYGVLCDLNNVAGIVVTQTGYQDGAKRYAKEWGVGIKELRSPTEQEGIIGILDLTFNISRSRVTFLPEDEWADINSTKLERYRLSYQQLGFNMFSMCNGKGYYSLTTIGDGEIFHPNGEKITTIEELQDKLPPNNLEVPIHTYPFDNAYINTREFGRVKIKEIKFEYTEKKQTNEIYLDGRSLIKAILKDALNGKIRVIARK